MSLQDDSGMSSVRDNKRANPPLGPLPKVIARNLIPKAKAEAASLAAQEDDHGGKMPARRVSDEEHLSSHLHHHPQVTSDTEMLPQPQQTNRRVTMLEPELDSTQVGTNTKNEGEMDDSKMAAVDTDVKEHTDDGWLCQNCTFHNVAMRSKCDMCQHKNPNYVSTSRKRRKK